MPDFRGNIVISGLTAAGKTTHAQLLARELKCTYVSGTLILARLCGVSVGRTPPRWLEIAETISARRSDAIDAELDQEILRLATTRVNQVFDVWALPWTSKDESLVRIWLNSTLESRAMKCYVSQGDAPKLALADCAPYIATKDEENRGLFLRTWSFDLFEDHDVFQVILDNSHFITMPTKASAARGIAAFAPFVRTAVDYCLGKCGSDVLYRMEEESFFGAGIVKQLKVVKQGG